MFSLGRIWPKKSQEAGASTTQETATGQGNSAPRPSAVQTQFGIKELAPGISPVVDIVAIHGLNGHREESWTAENKVLWLRDLLPTTIPTARILTYGYDANTGGKEQLTHQTLFDHAEALISKLVMFRKKTSTEERPIIFVGHSLGGIVLKYALIKANMTNKKHLPDHKAIEISTYGIIFLGTPHQGAEGVDLVVRLLEIQRIYSPTNTTVIKHLQRDSEFLQSQLALYASISDNFETKFVYEAYPTPIIGRAARRLLVPKSSAVVPGAVNAEAIVVYKDHKSMSKYASSEDDDFQTLCGHLHLMVKQAPQKIAEKWRQEKIRGV